MFVIIQELATLSQLLLSDVKTVKRYVKSPGDLPIAGVTPSTSTAATASGEEEDDDAGAEACLLLLSVLKAKLATYALGNDSSAPSASP